MNAKLSIMLFILLFGAACTLQAGGNSSTGTLQVGQMVPFGQFGDPSDFPFTIVAYDKSLGTDQVIGNTSPQVYGEKLNQATNDPNSGVRHYSGPPLQFRLVEVSGVTPGTTAMLLKSGRFVQMVPFAAGTTFEIGGDQPATAVFILKKAAWSGKNPIVCYELVPGQDHRLTELPHKTSGKYKGRESLDCSHSGEIAAGLSKGNRFRMNAIVARGGK